jgi:hypothetical protein
LQAARLQAADGARPSGALDPDRSAGSKDRTGELEQGGRGPPCGQDPVDGKRVRHVQTAVAQQMVGDNGPVLGCAGVLSAP